MLTKRSFLVPTKKTKQEPGSFSLMASSNHWLRKQQQIPYHLELCSGKVCLGGKAQSETS